MSRLLTIIDGGPRKNWNTAQLLEQVAQGARDAGADVKYWRLYDIEFAGCYSCFACKCKDVYLDMCAAKDGLTPVLEDVRDADALVVGSPLYFGQVTGKTRMFMERALFPYLGEYAKRPSGYGKKIKTAMVYTMNAFPEEFDKMFLTPMFQWNSIIMPMIFGGEYCDLKATETLQFDDYSKYQSELFDVEARLERHKTVFPQTLREAYELGTSIVGD